MRKGVSLYERIRVKYLKLILKGVKIIEEEKVIKEAQRLKGFDTLNTAYTNKSSKYNKYKFIIAGVLSVYLIYYFKNNYTQPEFEVRNQPNILIPKSIYDVRRRYYIYWELSRVARGLKKTFSYYNYDEESKLLYFVDKSGNNYIEKIIFNEERPDLLENPFLEFLLKEKPWDEKKLAKANKISAYYLSLNNRFDLDNYLHYKPITPADVFRFLYYQIMLKSGIADTYRYEQFIKKPDFLYDLEHMLVYTNLNSDDKKKVEERLIFFQFLVIVKIHSWWNNKSKMNK